MCRSLAHARTRNYFLLGRKLENSDVAVLVADVHLAVYDQRRAPRGREHVVRPMHSCRSWRPGNGTGR